MGTHCSEMFYSLRYPDGAGSQYHTEPVRTLDTWESTSKPDKKHLTWVWDSQECTTEQGTQRKKSHAPTLSIAFEMLK